MEFDKSKVYTAVNADELKVGSKVFVAKNLHTLRDQFCENNICTLIGIYSEDCQDRFCAKFDFDGKEVTTTLAYLVSEPEEKKLKWTDLKVGDVIRSKDGNTMSMITRIDNEDLSGYERHVYDGYEWYDDEKLAEWEKVEEE
jgi:hypothetical protein